MHILLFPKPTEASKSKKNDSKFRVRFLSQEIQTLVCVSTYLVCFTIYLQDPDDSNFFYMTDRFHKKIHSSSLFLFKRNLFFIFKCLIYINFFSSTIFSVYVQGMRQEFGSAGAVCSKKDISGPQNQRVHIVLKTSKSAGAKGDVPKNCKFVHPLHPC